MLKLIITQDKQGLVNWVNQDKKYWSGYKESLAVTFITLEKEGDKWILRKYLNVPVFGEKR